MTDNHKNQKIEITLHILKTIALGGAIAAVILLPGLAAAFAPFVQSKKQKDNLMHNMNTTVWRLKKRGFLKVNSGGKLSLTSRGQKLLNCYRLKELTIQKPKRWDGKWRVIAFDVWESRRTTRNLLRKTLQNLGFIKLQASLWIYPYDCEEMIELLKTDLKLSPAIQYMVVEKINQDKWLSKYFNL